MHKSQAVFLIHPAKLLRTFFNADTYSAEELLGAAFRRCGPFVAIGRPGERLTTPGADRMYVLDEEWQNIVLNYLKRCQAVVLQPAQSEGVHWEMEQIFALVPRNRVLVSMLNFKDRPTLYEGFRSWLIKRHGIELPISLPFRDTPYLVYFEGDGTARLQPICYRSPLLWTFVGDAVDTGRTFDTFIRGVHGDTRDLPHQQRKYRGHAALSIPTVAVVWVVFFLGLIFLKLLFLEASKDISSFVDEPAGTARDSGSGASQPSETTRGADR
jgi:hypothetical protein